MANFTTSADLINYALSQAGEKDDGTSDLNNDALTYLNRAYQSLWSGGSEIDPEINEVWWWLRKDTQGVLTLNPEITTGTVNVSNNSASATLSSAPAASMAGRHFKVGGHADIFIVSAHTAATTGLTLESVYTGDDNATASYSLRQYDYDLESDVLYLGAPMRAYQNNRGQIGFVPLEVLVEKWPIDQGYMGVPTNFAMIGEQKVRFSHFGLQAATDLIKVDYEYVKEPIDLADDSASPLVPRQYRKILADWTLALILDKKDDSRAAGAAALTKRGVGAMARENRRRMTMMSDRFGKILPRQNQLFKFNRILRTESGLIISG